MDYKTIFNLNGNEFIILNNKSEKISDIFERFISQCNVHIDKINFNYKGNNISQDSTVQEIADDNDKKNKTLIISLSKKDEQFQINKSHKINEIICPECNENILIKLQDYRIRLYECKNNHKFNNINFNEFKKFVYYNLSKLTCKNCNNENNINYNEFYFCISCGINLCQKCKTFHEKNHKIININNKNYICLKHNMHYIKYCKSCKVNICMKCENDHKSHNNIYFGDILINEDDIKKDMADLKEDIKKFINNINNLIKKLNSVKDNLESYYNETNDLINSHNSENINYQILQNMNEIKNYIYNIKKDINGVIEDNNIKNKFNKIMEMHKKMFSDEKEINDINDENDSYGPDFFKKINYNFKTCPINLNYKYDICKESYQQFEVFVSYKDNKEYIAYYDYDFNLYIYSLIDNRIIKVIKSKQPSQRIVLKYYFDQKDKKEYLIGAEDSKCENGIDYSYLVIWDIMDNYNIKLRLKSEAMIDAALVFPLNTNKNYIVIASIRQEGYSGSIKLFSLEGNFIKTLYKGSDDCQFLTYYNKKMNINYIIISLLNNQTKLMIYDLNNDSIYKLSDISGATILYNKDNHDYLFGSQLWDLTDLNIIKKTPKFESLFGVHKSIFWSNKYILGVNYENRRFLINNIDDGTSQSFYIKFKNDDKIGFHFMKTIYHPKYGESLLASTYNSPIKLWSH